MITYISIYLDYYYIYIYIYIHLHILYNQFYCILDVIKIIWSIFSAPRLPRIHPFPFSVIPSACRYDRPSNLYYNKYMYPSPWIMNIHALASWSYHSKSTQADKQTREKGIKEETDLMTRAGSPIYHVRERMDRGPCVDQITVQSSIFRPSARGVNNLGSGLVTSLSLVGLIPW